MAFSFSFVGWVSDLTPCIQRSAMFRFVLIWMFVGLCAVGFSQNALLRGHVYDLQTGSPVPFATVQLTDSGLGTTTDESGFFSFSEVTAGTDTLRASFVGYASVDSVLNIASGRIYYRALYLQPTSVDLATVDVSARSARIRSTVNVSAQRIAPDQVKQLPSLGGEPDLAQYLTVLPGVISSGDQGGQLFIRGGSPVQNKVLLDGLTIFNPFHSIGLFSVFETEAIQSVDVLTGGFQADHGGRVSAIMDIRTRTGHQREWHGLASVSPFQSRALIEGPLRPLSKQRSGGASILLTGKYGYLDQTSPTLYPYAIDEDQFGGAASDDIGLPFQYGDLYGKVTFSGGTGSKLNVFGLHFSDRFALPDVAELDWSVSGGGASFRLLPPNSQAVIDGVVGYTDYGTTLREGDGDPRMSGVVSYTAQLNFQYFGRQSELRYGLDFTGFNTDFSFVNPLGLTVQQRDFTSEIAGYFRYQYRFPRLIIEPGLRLHYYAAQSVLSPEPRLGVKYEIFDGLRLKASGGLYSQNVLGTTNEDDVVNFFVGFLAGPEQQLVTPDGNPAENSLQTAWHAVGGLEYDGLEHWLFNLEAYYKGFDQLVLLNRNKLQSSDPDFVLETGAAYGIELTAEYRTPSWYVWGTYSLARTERDDGTQIYPTVYDRRHNLNLLGAYHWNDQRWKASIRWNLGSGFPFTQTAGFYQDIPPGALLSGNSALTGNFPLNFLLASERNGGRLPPYHRLDLSMTRTFRFRKNSRLEMTASLTNAYNRNNVFYVDRITGARVDQLPVLPSLSATFFW